MVVNGNKEIVIDAKKSSFSIMELAIGRLKRGERREGIQMIYKAGMDDTFKNFGNEVEA